MLGAIIMTLLFEFTAYGRWKINELREAVSDIPESAAKFAFLIWFLVVSLMWPLFGSIFAKRAFFGGK